MNEEGQSRRRGPLDGATGDEKAEIQSIINAMVDRLAVDRETVIKPLFRRIKLSGEDWESLRYFAKYDLNLSDEEFDQLDTKEFVGLAERRAVELESAGNPSRGLRLAIDQIVMLLTELKRPEPTVHESTDPTLPQCTGMVPMEIQQDHVDSDIVAASDLPPSQRPLALVRNSEVRAAQLLPLEPEQDNPMAAQAEHAQRPAIPESDESEQSRWAEVFRENVKRRVASDKLLREEDAISKERLLQSWNREKKLQQSAKGRAFKQVFGREMHRFDDAYTIGHLVPLPIADRTVQAEAEPSAADQADNLPVDSNTALRQQRAELLKSYILETKATEHAIYNCAGKGKTHSCHKPQFMKWKDGTLKVDSSTTKSLENFLRAKRPPPASKKPD